MKWGNRAFFVMLAATLLVAVFAIPSGATSIWHVGDPHGGDPGLTGLTSVDVNISLPGGNFSLPNCGISSTGFTSCTDAGFNIIGSVAACNAVDHYNTGSSVPGGCTIGYPGQPGIPGTAPVIVSDPSGCTGFNFAPDPSGTAYIELIDAANNHWELNNLFWNATGGVPAGTAGTAWGGNVIQIGAVDGSKSLTMTLSGSLTSSAACFSYFTANSFGFTIAGSGTVS